MLHIADLKRYNRCPRLFWLGQQQGVPFTPYARFDEDIMELACQKLDVTDFFLGQANDSNEKTRQAMKEKAWLVKARFEYNDLRVKVPLMERKGKKWNLYFISTSIFPKIDELYKYRYTCAVLQKNNIEISEIQVIHLNQDYCRNEELNAQELLIITPFFYNAKGNSPKNIKDYISEKETDIDGLLKNIKKVKTAPKAEREPKCTRRSKCMFYDNCFPEEKELDKDSMLTLVSGQYKYEMYREGLRTLQEVDFNRLEGTRLQYAQINASKRGGLHLDYLGLGHWLSSQKYPIAFLDFEWETFIIPPYFGMKPYDVLPFQYSLHLMYEDGRVEHKEFLGVKDCREDFLKQLIGDLPNAGTVMAFNTEAAEKLRLKELEKQFPKYRKQLQAIQKRMDDLSIPFMFGLIYDTRMRGSYSLKTIMGIMDHNKSYDSLDINQGMEAVFHWRELEGETDPVRKNEIERQLLDYCSMDTYAMIVVYQWLKEKLQKELKDF